MLNETMINSLNCIINYYKKTFYTIYSNFCIIVLLSDCLNTYATLVHLLHQHKKSYYINWLNSFNLLYVKTIASWPCAIVWLRLALGKNEILRDLRH